MINEWEEFCAYTGTVFLYRQQEERYDMAGPIHLCHDPGV